MKRARPSRFAIEQTRSDRSLASISVTSVSVKMRSLLTFLFVFVAFLAISYASPYNKYGRTCKDILCTVREECVMQRDECTGFSDKCGSYPTCKRKPSAGKTGCAAMKCPTGHFCSIRQENCDKPPCQIKPTCIAFRTPSPNRASNLPDGNITTTTETYNTIPVTVPVPDNTDACSTEPDMVSLVTTVTPDIDDDFCTVSPYTQSSPFKNTQTTKSDF